jgi:hypothetical protein
MTSQEVALQVIQQAICTLADWAEAQLPAIGFRQFSMNIQP